MRLELDISQADPSRFASVVESVVDSGVRLTTLAELGNTTAHQKLLYELNATCAADIPDRGPFFTWSEYQRVRLEVPSFDPRGVVVALDHDGWVGLAATSDHRERGFVFSEMTGVLRRHRGRGSQWR